MDRTEEVRYKTFIDIHLFHKTSFGYAGPLCLEVGRVARWNQCPLPDGLQAPEAQGGGSRHAPCAPEGCRGWHGARKEGDLSELAEGPPVPTVCWDQKHTPESHQGFIKGAGTSPAERLSHGQATPDPLRSLRPATDTASRGWRGENRCPTREVLVAHRCCDGCVTFKGGAFRGAAGGQGLVAPSSPSQTSLG